jgi:hypothetical protein
MFLVLRNQRFEGCNAAGAGGGGGVVKLQESINQIVASCEKYKIK